MKGTSISIVYIVLMIAMFYFLLIRPQQTRQKKHQQLMNQLDVNTPVVTVGGILGTIVKIKDNSVVLRGIDNVKFEVLKSHIASVNQAAVETKED